MNWNAAYHAWFYAWFDWFGASAALGDTGAYGSAYSWADVWAT